MSKSVKHILLIVALLGMALVGVAHAKAPDHDTNDCAICLHQTFKDCHSSPPQLFVPTPSLIAEQSLAWPTPVTQSYPRTGYLGRAPPVSA
ncbi:hypothetical protein CW740_11790 [Kangiella profundi]|uniref:Uncharacterized protein n=1 Tax=Kangiella profundi TaxID=1561924 RepID=A0A2K9A7V8_9GAMM|nr:hypothetical protein [Kangiella profundi]AUD79895.1 hypothetical protein CW740_11790 [Kangiella profundi]GGE94431.1 hypothetical protein GCM10011356_05530 [Kangiella profundi]